MSIRKISLKGIQITKSIQISTLYTLFTQEVTGDFFYEGECHDFWEVVFCSGGELGITAGKYVYQLKAGECFFHKPMEFHNIWNQSCSGAQMRIITFACSSLLPIRHMPYMLSSDQIANLDTLFAEAMRLFGFRGGHILNLNCDNPCELQMFVNRLENLLLEILMENEVTEAQIKDRNAQRYLSAVEVMEANWDQRLTVGQVAEQCGMGEANLKKIFKKYAGIGVMEYFANLKTERAKRLLTEGNSVRETAQLLGFDDQNYFSVFFKRQTGVNPSKYVGWVSTANW